MATGNSDCASTSANLVRKHKAKSPAWDYFGLRVDLEGRVVKSTADQPVCKTCGKAVPSKGGSTTNLYTHLEDHHPELYSEVAPKIPKRSKATASVSVQPHDTSQPTLFQTIERSSVYAPNSSQAQELNRAVTYFLAKDMQPIATVDKPGFQHMVSRLNPRYQIPSRNHFANYEIPRLYNQVRDNVVKPSLAEVHYVSATTDLWTSSSTDPYISLTVHFIANDWSLKSFCLGTVYISADHTGQNIAEAITDILDNWELPPDKVVATTTDNGSNVIAAFSDLGWLRVSCFGHNLDLAINKGISITRVERAITKCKSLVQVFHRSWKKNRDLRLKQEVLGLPQHKLINSVATRWGSTYDMLARVVEQQQAISAVLAEDKKDWHRMPTDSDFTIFESVIEVLKPLSFLTDALSGEKQVTVSAILTIYKHVKEVLVVSEGDSRMVSEMKRVISNDFAQRNTSPEVQQLLSMASFLDPRFRDKYLEEKEEIISAIRSECIPLVSVTDPPCEIERAEMEPPVSKRPKGLAAILRHITPPNQEPGSSCLLTPEQKIDSEIASYLDFPRTDSNVDPLEWWRKECSRFPALAQLSKKYLCVCATSVPSERVFSRSGYVANPLRSRLRPDILDKLVFLSVNLQ